MRLNTRFRQINILFTALLLVFIISLITARIMDGDYTETHPTVVSIRTRVYILFAAAFLLLSVVPENRVTRIIQVFTLIGLGSAVVAYVAPRELGGDMVFVVATLLAYKYGMLNSHPILKISLIVGTLIAARGLATSFTDPIRLFQIVNLLGASIVTIPVLYWIFEDEFLRLWHRHRRLETAYHENQPFMEFGKNVTGIVHDFKNDLALFDTFGQYLALSEGDVIEPFQVQRYRSYVQRFAGRIERITMITKAAQRYDEEEGDLRTLLDSTLYVFQSNLTYRREITFDISLPEEPVIVRVPPAPVVSILENILSNSCEALMEDASREDGGDLSERRISVSVARDADGIQIGIEDTGPGLPFCRHRGGENCLDCPSVGLGRTTKEEGTGIGLVTIRRHSEGYGIPVHISNKSNGGVRAVIMVDRDRVLSSLESPIGVEAEDINA